VPNFAENSWQKVLMPALQKCSGTKELKEHLVDMGWPEVSKPVDPAISALLDYLRTIKSEIRLV